MKPPHEYLAEYVWDYDGIENDAELGIDIVCFLRGGDSCRCRLVDDARRCRLCGRAPRR